MFTLALAGCTAGRPLTPAVPPLPAADLQQILAQRRDALHSLRSEASLSVSSPERSGKAKQFLLVERPDRLRVEVFSPFGTVFALTTADGALAAYVREENRVYRGSATPQNLARYAALDLQVADVVDLVLGGPPRRQVQSASVYAEPSTGRLRLRQETGSGAQIVLFAGEPLLPVEVQEVDDDGKLLWRATFAEYQPVSGLAVATRIGVEVPGAQQNVEIALRNPEANPVLAAGLFALPSPRGTEDVRL